MKKAPIVLLFALAAVAILPLPATALPIHRHLVVVQHKQVRVPDDHHVAKVPVKKQIVRVEHVAPPAPTPAPTVAAQSQSVAPSTPTTTSVPAPAATTSGGCGGITPYSGGGQCWAIPYSIVQCESGGSYSAYNPSGASGAYQLMSGGGGSPAEQDAAAAALWNGGAGASNWVCAG